MKLKKKVYVSSKIISLLEPHTLSTIDSDIGISFCESPFKVILHLISFSVALDNETIFQPFLNKLKIVLTPNFQF